MPILMALNFLKSVSFTNVCNESVLVYLQFAQTLKDGIRRNVETIVKEHSKPSKY